MRGKFFGYVHEKPCQHCGTSRIGHDCDDDYYITPGRLEKVEKGCQWEKSYSPDAQNCPDLFNREFWNCPECGAPVGIRWSSCNDVKTVDLFCADGSRTQKYIPLKGCQKCSQSSHHYGMLG